MFDTDQAPKLRRYLKFETYKWTDYDETCLGIKLYALYGMYLLLPGRGNRIWKEK